jgi:PTH1 family peptidyl-tRNA hydrolase
VKRKKSQRKRNREARVRFIVGLGNPGLAYRVTRHNLGFMVIDRLARKHGISLSTRKFRTRFGEGKIVSAQVVLIKPQTYMNLSGLCVQKLLSYYDDTLKNLIVIHDDLDLSMGSIRIRRKGGHGGHKGVQSIIQSLGGRDFVRIKVGIGRPRSCVDVTDYVLHPFEGEERTRLGSVLSRAVEAVEVILLEGVDRAMSAFNVAVSCEKRDK